MKANSPLRLYDDVEYIRSGLFHSSVSSFASVPAQSSARLTSVFSLILASEVPLNASCLQVVITLNLKIDPLINLLRSLSFRFELYLELTISSFLKSVQIRETDKNFFS